MPTPPSVLDTVAFRSSDNDIFTRVAEKLSDGSMAFKVDIVRGGDFNIGEVQIQNVAGSVINPATQETLVDILNALGGATGVPVNVPGSAPSVPTGVPTDIVAYTVPSGKIFYLRHATVSGDNIAKFKILVNGVVQCTKRTWWADFNADFFFEADGGEGLMVPSGQVIKIVVEHSRPVVGNFEGNLAGRLT